MGQHSLNSQRRAIITAYVLVFFGLFLLVPAVIGYCLARKVAYASESEVWLQAHGLWLMRNVALALLMAVFASLWFIPLLFVYWSSVLWATATTLVGVVFALVAWLFLLNAWLKGIGRFWQKKAVY